MPSPFPGMDPYLEDPEFWPGKAIGLIVVFTELLNVQLRPRYWAEIVQGNPCFEFDRNNTGQTATNLYRDRYARRIEIETVDTRRLVAVVELLNYLDKTAGSQEHTSLATTRRAVMASGAHWVEIDLLRHGVPSEYRKQLDPHEYAVHVSPADMRPQGRVWPIRIQGPLPTIGIPLRAPDPDAPLDLQRALELAYERGAYHMSVDYTRPPVPPLPPPLAKWANKLLRQKKLR